MSAVCVFDVLAYWLNVILSLLFMSFWYSCRSGFGLTDNCIGGIINMPWSSVFVNYCGKCIRFVVFFRVIL